MWSQEGVGRQAEQGSAVSLGRDERVLRVCPREVIWGRCRPVSLCVPLTSSSPDVFVIIRRHNRKTRETQGSGEKIEGKIKFSCETPSLCVSVWE